MPIGVLIPLLILIVALNLILKKKTQKEQTGNASPSGKGSGKTVFETWIEELQGEEVTHPIQTDLPESFAEKEMSRLSSSSSKNAIPKEMLHTPRSNCKPIEEVDSLTTEPFEVPLSEAEELRRAIIASEILQRKYK